MAVAKTAQTRYMDGRVQAAQGTGGLPKLLLYFWKNVSHSCLCTFLLYHRTLQEDVVLEVEHQHFSMHVR